MQIEGKQMIMRRPDNWHNHFRHKGDPRFKPTVQYIASQFARANAMGNLPTPITTAGQMVTYKRDIIQAAGHGRFEPLMVIMMTPHTTPEMVDDAIEAGAYGIKVMPAHGTTNSAHGIEDYTSPLFRDCLKVIRSRSKTLLLHAELPSKDGQTVPMKLRSKLFIPTLQRIRDEFPDLRICVEHIDVKELVDLVVEGGERICATVTPHHMEVTAEDADHDDHYKCMPYPKDPSDREAILQVVMNGHPRFFYGSDNAPHLLPAKQTNPPASGVFTAPVELGATADLFERHKALALYERFMSELGAKWHGFPLNDGTVTLIRDPYDVPEVIQLGQGHQIVPYKHGERLNWRVAP